MESEWDEAWRHPQFVLRLVANVHESESLRKATGPQTLVLSALLDHYTTPYPPYKCLQLVN